MKKPSLYLSGPIGGLNYEQSTTWREFVANTLTDFECWSPLRGKSYLKKMKVIDGAPGQLGLGGLSSVLSSEQGILFRDAFDCFNCDGTLVNLLGTTRVSIGTVMEIAWVWQQRKPIIIVMEKDVNLHNHPMINASTPYIVETLEEGMDIARIVFLP